MSKGNVLFLNSVLLLAVAGAFAHGWYWGVQFRPRVVVNAPRECGPGYLVEELDIGWDADSIARTAQVVIYKKGQLPNDPVALTNSLLDEAITDLKPHTFGDFINVGPKGELIDCWGKPFEIQVSDDRVSVTSDSSLTFYFAAIEKAQRVQ